MTHTMFTMAPPYGKPPTAPPNVSGHPHTETKPPNEKRNTAKRHTPFTRTAH
jgi:hypothetical protein